jgi:hypothetical protein
VNVDSLIFLPRHFYDLGNVSFYSLLKDTGYLDSSEKVTQADIRKALLKHPECIDEWRRLSEDKRTTGWYLKEPSSGCYEIGYIPVEGEDRIDPLEYQDEVSACSAFIKLELENVRMTALKTEARRRKHTDRQ